MPTWIEKAQPGRPGLRVAVKDLIDVAGLRTTAGCRAVAETAEPATADAACLAGLRAAEAAGTAHLAGKTNLHELAYGITGVNAFTGTPVNPRDPSRVPGGSSSGSATAVAAGEADVAYGSDTGGSVRIPSACCGIAGLKTTWGRISLEGVWPLGPSFDTVGPMAADVAGLVTGMALLEPGFRAGEAPPGRIGRLQTEGHPAVEAAVDRALAAAGWEQVAIPIDGWERARDAALTILGAEAWACNRSLVISAGDAIGEDVRQRLLTSADISAGRVEEAREVQRGWQTTMARLFEQVDLLALPTLLGPPPTLDRASEMWAVRGVTIEINMAGAPALALPLHGAGPLPGTGVPASLQLVGPPGAEDRLLAAGAALEAAGA